MSRDYESGDNSNWIAFIVVSIIVGLFLFSAYGCVSGQTVDEANQANIEAAAPPDFYDRGGNACWRLSDLIWCEDGYGSWQDDDTDETNQE